MGAYSQFRPEAHQANCQSSATLVAGKQQWPIIARSLCGFYGTVGSSQSLSAIFLAD